jgi:hypothetical protein
MVVGVLGQIKPILFQINVVQVVQFYFFRGIFAAFTFVASIYGASGFFACFVSSYWPTFGFFFGHEDPPTHHHRHTVAVFPQLVVQGIFL